MNNYTYKVVDVTVPLEHNSQTKLAKAAEAVINEHGSKSWRLHTYKITGFGRTPGFLGVTFENVCHLVFERAADGRKEEKGKVAETPETTSEGSGVSWEKYNELTRKRELEKRKR